MINVFVEPIVQLITRISSMEPVPPSEALIATTAGIIGDLVQLYEGDIIRFFLTDNVRFYYYYSNLKIIFQVTQMLQKGRKSKVSKTKSMANWATKEIKKVTLKNRNSFFF